MSENNHQILNSKYSEGHVCSPGLLYGSIGLLLALLLQKFGFFQVVDSSLQSVLASKFTPGDTMDTLSIVVLVVISAVYSIGIAWGILDSKGAWRRIVILMTAMVLVVAMVPTLAVWNIYFSPFLILTSVFVTSLCVMIYASFHRMPCDLADY